jgi:hypothetical protein
MARRLAWGVALSLALVACKKDEKKPETKPGSDGKTVPAEKDKPGAAPKSSGDDLSMIPVDSEIVMGVKFAALTGSTVWKQFVEPEMMKDQDFVKGMKDFKERCGFDPMTTVTGSMFGLSKLDGDKPEGVFVLHGLDKAKTMACADKWKADIEKEGTTFKKDGDVILLHDNDADVAVTFVGDRLLGVVGSKATVDGIKQVAAGGSGLATSQAFVDMYGKIDKNATAWFLGNGSAKIFEELSSLGVRPKAIFGHVTVNDGLNGELRARLDSADQAAQTVKSFEGQIKAFASMVDKLDITADGADVKVQAAASATKLASLFKMFAGGGM